MADLPAMSVEALSLVTKWALDVKPQPPAPAPNAGIAFLGFSLPEYIDFMNYKRWLFYFTRTAARLLTVARLGEPLMRMRSRLMLHKMHIYYLEAKDVNDVY